MPMPDRKVCEAEIASVFPSPKLMSEENTPKKSDQGLVLWWKLSLVDWITCRSVAGKRSWQAEITEIVCMKTKTCPGQLKRGRPILNGLTSNDVNLATPCNAWKSF